MHFINGWLHKVVVLFDAVRRWFYLFGVRFYFGYLLFLYVPCLHDKTIKHHTPCALRPLSLCVGIKKL